MTFLLVEKDEMRNSLKIEMEHIFIRPEIREKMLRVIFQWNWDLSSSLTSVKGSLNEMKQYRDPLPKYIERLKCFYMNIHDFSHR